jgi:YYY domain-containing protein
MISFFLWYILTTIVGWATFPLVFRMLPGLADRGYAFSRSLGLLLWGYLLWVLCSLGFIHNDPGGVLLAFGGVVALSIYSLLGVRHEEVRGWLKEHFGLVVVVEVLFLTAFAAWALVRAYNPDIVATEKPMELAFLNAILRSPSFPPHDPWLSGYAISYYYFGYVLVAMLAQLTYTHAGIAFNLGISLVFALSVLGAYGLVYNLLAARVGRIKKLFQPNDSPELRDQETELNSRLRENGAVSKQLWGLAFLGPIFVLIISNLEGLLEILHARGLFWRLTESGIWTSRFWAWLDMKELSQPPVEPFTWMPTRYLWWWRASRVISDYDVVGTFKEVIDEFPFFSYLLADLHPHVLAMPFVLLAMVLALNLFLGGMPGRFRWVWFYLDVNSWGFWMSALILGGLAFLNTWDFPIYVALFAGAYGVRRMMAPTIDKDIDRNDTNNDFREGFTLIFLFKNFLKNFLLMGLALGLSGVMLYLPFYLTFSSQAGGVLPNLINPTRGAHFWVMFGSLLFPLLIYLIYLWKKTGVRNEIVKGLILAISFLASLLVVSLLMGWVIASFPFLEDVYLTSLGAAGRREELFSVAFSRRFTQTGGWMTLLVLMAISIGLGLQLIRKKGEAIRNGEDKQMAFSVAHEGNCLTQSHLFSLLLLFLGTLVVLAPEFFFLRDHFGTRMNTVFKFYYQGWLLWAIAAAFGTAFLLYSLRGISRIFFVFGLALVLGAGLVYPTLSLWTKTNGFHAANGLTLDGTAYLTRQSPDEVEAINWLQEAPLGVLVEAIGSSYSVYGRTAAHSGQPSVLNWPFHQIQWRGSAEILGSRQSDVERIYTSNNWIEVETLLHQYDVRYVYVGPLERNAYRISSGKFERFLATVFKNESVTIYQTTWELE